MTRDMIRGTIIIAASIFLLLIGYNIFLKIRPEPYIDDSAAHELYELLIENGFDVVIDDDFASSGFNDKKSFYISTPIDDDFELDEPIHHPEFFSVFVYLYTTENDAIIKTGQFSPKGDMYLNDYGRYTNFGSSLPVHFYRMRNAIIQYYGINPTVQALLEEHCGKQFAGA